MSTNFLQHNPGLVNQESDVSYAADLMRLNGITAGVIPSTFLNKIFYQITTMSAALSQMLSDKGYTVSDTDISALKTVLANIASAPEIQRNAFQYAADTGSANAYAVSLSPAITSYAAGLEIFFKVTNANSGASTLAVNGLTAKSIKKTGGAALVKGDLQAGDIVHVVYDGTFFQKIGNAPMGLNGVSVYSSAGTFAWSRPNGVTNVFVQLWAGGGAAGGATPPVSGVNAGAGGGGGGYSEKLITLGSETSVTITVGHGGAAAAGLNGGDGEASSFGTYISATPGLGGVVNGATQSSPGTGVSGDVNLTGNYGQPGYSIPTSPVLGFGGIGGGSPKGGLSTDFAIPTSSLSNGIAGNWPGGGGCGSTSPASSSNSTGGPGAVGLVVVRW